MKNYLHSSDEFQYTVASSSLAGGSVRLVGGRLGVAKITGAVGDTIPMMARGTFSGLPKATGAAWTKGQVLYWHTTNNNFTTSATGAIFAGWADAAAASGDTTGTVALSGQAAV